MLIGINFLITPCRGSLPSSVTNHNTLQFSASMLPSPSTLQADLTLLSDTCLKYKLLNKRVLRESPNMKPKLSVSGPSAPGPLRVVEDQESLVPGSPESPSMLPFHEFLSPTPYCLFFLASSSFCSLNMSAYSEVIKRTEFGVIQPLKLI